MPVRRGEEKTAFLNRALFLLPAGFVLLADQLSKAWAQLLLDPGSSLPVVPRVFHLTLIQNEGIAFGLFQGADQVLLALITLSLVALVVVGFRLRQGASPAQWGLGLILGGALGNWIDRIRTGAVVDFLDFRIWPVFNLADTAITLGVGIFLWEFFRRRVS